MLLKILPNRLNPKAGSEVMFVTFKSSRQRKVKELCLKSPAATRFERAEQQFQNWECGCTDLNQKRSRITCEIKMFHTELLAFPSL